MRSTRSTAAMIDDLDAITPCPPGVHYNEPEPLLNEPSTSTSNSSPLSFHGLRSSRSSRASSPSSECDSPVTASEGNTNSTVDASSNGHRRRQSVKALEDGTEGDPERLWRRMLVLQQIYGCYNSARMSAALSSGDASLLLPSKACLDMLNENMAALPDDAELAIEHWKHKTSMAEQK